MLNIFSLSSIMWHLWYNTKWEWAGKVFDFLRPEGDGG